MRNFVTVIGDLSVDRIGREDALQFRGRWTDRIDDGLCLIERVANRSGVGVATKLGPVTI